MIANPVNTEIEMETNLIKLENKDIIAGSKRFAKPDKEMVVEFRWINGNVPGRARLRQLSFPARKLKEDGPLRRMLENEGVDLEEFSRKYWDKKPPNTYIDGTNPIDAGYKTPDIEVTALCMLGFMESPGDHRS